MYKSSITVIAYQIIQYNFESLGSQKLHKYFWQYKQTITEMVMIHGKSLHVPVSISICQGMLLMSKEVGHLLPFYPIFATDHHKTTSHMPYFC